MLTRTFAMGFIHSRWLFTVITVTPQYGVRQIKIEIKVRPDLH